MKFIKIILPIGIGLFVGFTAPLMWRWQETIFSLPSQMSSPKSVAPTRVKFQQLKRGMTQDEVTKIMGAFSASAETDDEFTIFYPNTDVGITEVREGINAYTVAFTNGIVWKLVEPYDAAVWKLPESQED